MSESRVLRLIESIYQASLDPSLWDAFTEELSEALGDAAVCVSLQLPGFTTPPVMYVKGFDEAYYEILMSHMREGLPWEEIRRSGWVGHFESAESVVNAAQLADTPFYQDCMKPLGLACSPPIGHTIALEGDEPLATVVAFAREAGRPLDARDLELGDQLVPHLKRAYEIHRKMWEMAALARILNRIPTGLVMLNAMGQPVHSNTSARRISKLADGLSIESTGVRLDEPEDQEVLEDTLAVALQSGTSQSDSVLRTLTVQRPSGRRPFTLVVRPLLEDRPESTLHDARAVLYISDLELSSQRDAQTLQGRYGLTRAEAQLASLLCAGLSLENVAEQRKVSIHTVRSQLKQVFAKTGTSRQSELVGQLLADLPPAQEI